MNDDFLTNLCSNTFFENMGYAAGKDGAPLTGVHLALFIAFCINLFVVLCVSIVSLCCVPPAKISKKMKLAKLISLLDLYAVFLPDKKQKKEKHNDDDNVSNSKCKKTKRSVSGAVMTLLCIWFLSGALLVLVKQRNRLVPFTITESQELSSVLSTKNQYFNMATVFLAYLPSESDCSIFAKDTIMKARGNDVSQVGNVQYKAVPTDRYSPSAYCYVYQEWKMISSPTGYQSPVSISVQIVGDATRYSSSASLGFVSLPWDTAGYDYWAKDTLETQTPKEMVNYLKRLGGFCAKVQSGASVSLTVEPKSFQYPVSFYYGSSQQNPIFSNIVHFPKQVERWSATASSQYQYDVTLNFTPRRALYAEGQSSFNTLLLAVLTIAIVLLVCTWIRKVVMTISSLCQKSLRARLLALVGLFLVMCAAYGVMGWLIAQNMLFPDATISTLSLSSVIYTSLLLFSAFIHVAVYHSKYKAYPFPTEPVSAFPTVQTYEANFQAVPQHVPYPETTPLYPSAHNPNAPLNVVYRPHPTYQ